MRLGTLVLLAFAGLCFAYGWGHNAALLLTGFIAFLWVFGTQGAW